MKKQLRIILEGETALVMLAKYRRSRCLRISVHTSHEATVTGPWRTSWKALEDYFWQHREWVERQWKALEERPRASLEVSDVTFQAKKAAAKQRAEKILTELSDVYGFEYGRVTIRNQKTRWGSCSSQKNLSFHVRLADLPEDVARYLVAHELCHTKEMNHGPRFWALVARVCPNYEDLKKRLYSSILEEDNL